MHAYINRVHVHPQVFVLLRSQLLHAFMHPDVGHLSTASSASCTSTAQQAGHLRSMRQQMLT